MGTTSTVGALSLPLAAAGAKTALSDPTVDLLLAFVGHIWTADIDPKLADWTATGAVSCPAAKRFNYDPKSRRGHKVKFPLPSLFIWWEGKSQTTPHTQLYSYRQRDINLLYLFPELPGQEATDIRSGLFNALDSSLSRWARKCWHPTFTYNGAAAGQTIVEMIADGNQLMIEYVGGTGVPRIGIDDANQARLGARTSGRDHPGFAALFRVAERIDWLEADNANVDHAATIKHDGVTVISGTLAAPDGAEEWPEE